MKWILLLVLTLYSILGCADITLPSPLPVIDGSEGGLPKRFRILKENGMRLIGSGQFSRDQLIHVQQKINAPIWIVDLRQETHGFVNEWAVSLYGEKNWANKHKLPNSILTEQEFWLKSLSTQTTATFYIIQKKEPQGIVSMASPRWIPIHTVNSEEELAKKLGMAYKRFFIADHTPPTMEQVEAFDAFLKTIPKNTWLYLHCRGGAGRTSTFTALYAIHHFAKTLSLEEILRRQVDSGSKDLTILPAKTSYTYTDALKRSELIKKYYEKQKAL